jgi:PAS domain S-box-containing protein
MRNGPGKDHHEQQAPLAASVQHVSPFPVEALAQGGEMGLRMQALDWSQTPVGRMEQWPPALATLVATSLYSRFPIVIWWDRNYYTTFYNDAYIPFLGKTKHPGWLGRSGKECWHEIWPTIGPMLESVFETGRPTWSEDLLLVLDRNLPREENYFTFSYSAIVGESGKVDGIFCACTETTERVLSERRLRTLRDLSSRASEARTAEEACGIAAHLLGNNPVDIPFALIYLLDSEHTVARLVALSGLSSSHKAAPATIALSSSSQGRGWPLFEVAQRGTSELVKLLPEEFGALPGGPWPEASDAALALPLKAPEQKQVTGFLVVGVNPRRVLDEPYRDFLQLVAGHVATAVSNARAYEEERKRAEALAELDRAKTVFFNNISHEFRTPLTLMLGPIEELGAENGVFSPASHERITLLQNNARRLLKLVNTLLDFSRIEANRIQATYEPTDLATLTADLASAFRSAIEKAGMQLIVECQPLAEKVYVDHDMWEKIILNLLSNALKYTLAGSITVSLRQRGTQVECAVQDTGVGIPAEELPHLFERFYRVKGVEGRTYEGTGIGLSLVQELVKLHDGSVRVQSAPGIGSTFTVSIPLGTKHLPPERIAPKPIHTSMTTQAQVYVEEAIQLFTEGEQPSALLSELIVPLQEQQENGTLAQPGQEKQGKAARILFADDNADMRAYVSRLLQRRYDVLAVPNGGAALAAVKEYAPDLVLSDVMMPGMDGFELLHRLRADAETSDLPVILLSARAGEEAQVEGLEAGADDYLIKPFSAGELLARVGAHLEMARLRKQAEERFHTLADNISQFAWMADETGWIFWYNQRWYDYTGSTFEQMQGWGWQSVHHPDHVQRVVEKISHCFQTGEEWEDTFPLRGKDGEYRWFLSRAVPIRDEQGKVRRWFGTNTDITEQRQLERQKDEFLSIASHELKTPVTSIKAYAQLLERRFRQSGDTNSADLVQRMDEQTKKLTRLVEDLLDVTKIENGQLMLHRSSFDFNELVHEVVEDTQRAAATHTIVEKRAASVTLYADRDRIGQVLTNLLTNAIKYSPRADTILVETTCTDEAIIASVRDFGMGIPKEKQSHLFQRFYRVEGDSQLTYPGLGLGLYISAEFLKRHRGTIWIESVEDQGTTVSFSLPLHSLEEGADSGEEK